MGGSEGLTFCSSHAWLSVLWAGPTESSSRGLKEPNVYAFVLVPLASLVLGQVALTDRIDGFVALTLPRTESKARWWVAKLVAMGAASVVFFAVAFLAAVIVGWVATGRLGWSLSPYGAATPDPWGSPVEAARYFSPPPLAGLWAPVRVAVVYLYSAIATWALIACCVLPTARWPKAWIPIASTLGVVGVFWRVAPTNLLHPLVHLLWDYHTLSRSVVVGICIVRGRRAAGGGWRGDLSVS